MEISRRRSTRRRRKNKPPATNITDLPEAILLHIISFLPTLDAIRISLAAPSWRNLWLSLPNLDFNMHYFQEQITGKSNRLVRLLFADFVSQSLNCLPYESTIQTFKLLFFYRNYDHIRAYVDSWVTHLVCYMRPVEIDWNFVWHNRLGYHGDDDRTMDMEAPYEFHIYDIESSKSIEVLKLGNCRLGFPEDEQLMTLHSIKEVHLERYPGSATDIEQLMASCVNLETFVLDFLGISEDLEIISRNLKHLRFINAGGDMYTVEINAPRLESIEIDRAIAYDLKHVSSLVEAKVGVDEYNMISSWSWWNFACWVNVLSFFTGVKRLTIHNIPQEKYDLGEKHPPAEDSSEEGDIKLLKGAKVFSELSEFHSLVYLNLKTGYWKDDILSLKVLLNKCPRLETMVLVWDDYSRHNQSVTPKKKEIADILVDLQIPRLREVKMEGYMGTKSELYVVDQLKKHGVVLEKIVAFPAKVGESSPPPFVL